MITALFWGDKAELCFTRSLFHPSAHERAQPSPSQASEAAPGVGLAQQKAAGGQASRSRGPGGESQGKGRWWPSEGAQHHLTQKAEASSGLSVCCGCHLGKVTLSQALAYLIGLS